MKFPELLRFRLYSYLVGFPLSPVLGALRLERDDLLVHDGHAAVVLHLDVVHLRLPLALLRVQLLPQILQLRLELGGHRRLVRDGLLELGHLLVVEQLLLEVVALLSNAGDLEEIQLVSC